MPQFISELIVGRLDSLFISSAKKSFSAKFLKDLYLCREPSFSHAMTPPHTQSQYFIREMNYGVLPQSKELVRGPPELVQHFRLQGEFTSAQGRCMS
jgi:hypothetical protein